MGMGILKDGTPYLTARGLARMCGIDHTLLLDLANEWDVEKSRPRGRKIASILAEQGLEDPIAIFVQYKPDPGLEPGTFVWKTNALPVKLIGRKVCWFPTLAGDDGLPAPTTVYDDHWSSVGHKIIDDPRPQLDISRCGCQHNDQSISGRALRN